MVVFLLRLVWTASNYTLVVLPTWIMSMLQRQFLVTLSLLLIAVLACLLVSITYYVVRQRYLRKYSADTTPPKKDAPAAQFSQGLDYVAGAKKKRGTDRSKNYLDEFLSAIKVFGYLERPVFHELTKNMTTQKLAGDEILCLDEGVGFSIVVEGTVQVYTKMDDVAGPVVDFECAAEGREKDEILLVSNHRYHLLNEVKSGSSLLSLLSTVDLFKSDAVGAYSRKHSALGTDSPAGFPFNASGTASFDGQAFMHRSPSFHASPNGLKMPESPVVNSAVSPLEGLFHDTLPAIIARPKALQDVQESTATIAIIPCLAFQRVYHKFPKATSHIVTMVLTRLYKVTLSAVHNYLGLTKEVMESEIALNDISAECKLPSYLAEGVLESLRHQWTEAPASELSLLVRVMPKLTKKARRHMRENSSRYVILASRYKASHPGDLLSAVPLSRRPDFNRMSLGSAEKDVSAPAPSARPLLQKASYNKSYAPTLASIQSSVDVRERCFSDEREETEETSLRTAIVENLFKLLGIEEDQFGPGFQGLQTGHTSASSSVLYTTFHQNTGKPEKGPETASARIANSQEQNNLANGLEPSFSTVKNAFSKNIEVKYYAPGTAVVTQNSFDTGLFYVIHGRLDVSTCHKNDGDDSMGTSVNKRLYSVNPGGLAGYLSTIVGFRSLVSVTSSSEEGAVVAHISKKDFLTLLDKYYFLQLPVASKLKHLLPSMIKTIDFALEWCHIPAGGVLATQGDLANGFHIVLSGRFRVIRDNSKKVESGIYHHNQSLVDEANAPQIGDKEESYEVLGEYGHGQSIGEVEVLTATRRTNSLIAVRDSETARIPRTLFEMLSSQNPAIMVQVSRIVANRVLKSNDRENFATLATSNHSRAAEVNKEYKTITILPCVSGLPVRDFADRLTLALRAIGRNVIALDRASTLTHLGRHAFDERLAHLKLSGYFAYLEEKYETVVYVCDTPLKSKWTSTCISQGDCILLLADAEDDECATNVGDYERLLLKLKTTAKTDLCLIHSDKSVIPGSTSIWLQNRIWVQDHHHVEMAISRDRAVNKMKKKNNLLLELAMKISSKANPNIKHKLENVRSRALESWMKLNNRVNKHNEVPVAHKNDFMRLARILSNEAVGLVLGGGGSRGISHVGVVTALEKHGIPVDVIGGTSIGSFVGGLYAKENNIVSIYGMSKKFSSRVGSLWRNIFDLTYPVTSYITGYEFNRGISKVFGYHEIEDFWIKYFCNSTNITMSKMEIHQRGYAWRFIRASMSLAGLLPPIAYNGSMLLDGGYLDNLPVLEMKNRGAKYIIAVDVGSVDDRTPMNYGDTLSGFWVLFNRINPFSKHPNVPNMMDIQLRLAYVASVYALEIAKKTPGVIYLRPPIDDYATLDFLKFDEIYNVGLAYADEILTRFRSVFSLMNGTKDEPASKGSAELCEHWSTFTFSGFPFSSVL
ncbi:patatin-domain-containing protein [Metschnikowia bicuspidata var. bicuspidata NRRL YB-4993]|uniref:Lysophospholipase NTE1 n=1 Tax=Metschnikowia bicuspidata var. bicuspidata NRRL YB-4993 TaxID=869754 RepID=A0A1A0H6F5_9ASCO|nr:patatin-domain-containing protein [Metschnikowia bicuspidata var. bicuspidata NRRL YB-4993]OBA19487.1 patatin-domain-containing protein [Metschnikowia bicuspidata var. bicuspidata NRRL YB-4993]